MNLCFNSYWDKPFNLNLWTGNWRQLMLYVLDTCPELNKLRICFNQVIIQELQTQQFIATVQFLLSWFADKVLLKINSECAVYLEFDFALLDAYYVC